MTNHDDTRPNAERARDLPPVAASWATFGDGDASLQALIAFIRPQLDADPGHDEHHARRVIAWTLALRAPDDRWRDAVAAGLLHDVINLPKNDPCRAEASVRSAGFARRHLGKFGFDDAATDRIAEAIEDHSYSRGQTPRSSLGCALQDADRLEALGAMGIYRTIATGIQMGAALVDQNDPFATNRPLDDQRYTVDHFYRKLLKLPATMQTPRGRKEAERRTHIMRAFLDALGSELDPAQTHRTRDSCS